MQIAFRVKTDAAILGAGFVLAGGADTYPAPPATPRHHPKLTAPFSPQTRNATCGSPRFVGTKRFFGRSPTLGFAMLYPSRHQESRNGLFAWRNAMDFRKVFPRRHEGRKGSGRSPRPCVTGETSFCLLRHKAAGRPGIPAPSQRRRKARNRPKSGCFSLASSAK
jgi:hypothetical protein